MAYFSGEFWAELTRPRKFLILLYKSFRLSAGQSVKPPIDVKWDASSWALVINTFECQLLWSGGFRKLKWLVWSLVWLTRKLKHDGSAPGNSKYLVLTPYEFLVLLHGLSPPQRSLRVAGMLGERKRKRAGHAARQPRSHVLSPTRSLAP